MCGGDKYLYVLDVELALCHPSGTQCFEVAPRFLEKSCIYGFMAVRVTKEIFCVNGSADLSGLVAIEMEVF